MLWKDAGKVGGGGGVEHLLPLPFDEVEGGRGALLKYNCCKEERILIFLVTDMRLH